MTTPAAVLARLISAGVLVPGCERCDRDAKSLTETGSIPFGPDHKPSPRCRSGRRPHCTCDTCF